MNAARIPAPLPEENGHPKLRKLKATLTLIIPAALAASVLAFSGTASAAPATVASPSAFSKDFEAAIASDGKQLWMAATSGSDRTQILEYRDGSWKGLPGKPGTGSDYGIDLATLKPTGSSSTIPCLGDVSGKTGRVRCHQNGGWQKLTVDDSLKGMYLGGLRSEGASLTALFSRWDFKTKSMTLRLASTTGDRISPSGPKLKLNGQYLASLGTLTSDAPNSGIEVALQLQSGKKWGARRVATLVNDRWAISKDLPKRPAGSQLSGTVLTKNRTLFPVVEGAFGGGWPFSVYGSGEAWTRVGAKPLIRKGANQGGIFAVGKTVWATWHQTGLVSKKANSSDRQFASRLSANGKKFEKKVLLAKSGPIGPGVNRVVEYRGHPAFLYMTKLSNGKVKATVNLSVK